MNTLYKIRHRRILSVVPHYFAAATLIFVLTSWAGTAAGTTIVSTNLAELSELADDAFVVHIDNMETSTSGNRSFDIVTATVVEPVFGDKQASETVTWRQFRFGRSVPLPAMPTYQTGKEYLIFLSGPGTGPGYQMPVGLGQGAFTITRNPQTGAAIARNAYMNSTLNAGLNVDAAAEAMAAREGKARGLNKAAQEAEAAKLKTQLSSRGAGINLEALKTSARFFHEEKQRGAKPSRDYKTTAPVRMLH
jgi:hypothetical protein